jgi:hypothetical protein
MFYYRIIGLLILRFGQVYRMNNERIVKKSINGNHRNVNCMQTKNRWEGDFMKDLKLLNTENWTKCIQNRD